LFALRKLKKYTVPVAVQTTFPMTHSGEDIMTVPPVQRQRGGCLTAWLAVVIIINPLVSLNYLATGSNLKDTYPHRPGWAIPVLILAGFANCIFGIAVWKWQKWGVYGFVAVSLLAFVVNVASGIPIILALFGFVGLAILAYLVRNVWDQMEGPSYSIKIKKRESDQ
jgi:hypothetical protein